MQPLKVIFTKNSLASLLIRWWWLPQILSENLTPYLVTMQGHKLYHVSQSYAKSSMENSLHGSHSKEAGFWWKGHP